MGSFLDGLNNEQREAVLDTEGVMLLLAGAGSGKTRVLTCRVANLLSKGVPSGAILAITFTNKAAREMRDRILSLVGTRAEGVWMMTFHAFCVRFLRSEIHLLDGFSGNFTIYDDNDSKSLVKTILKDLNMDLETKSVLSFISNCKNAMKDSSSIDERYLSYLQKFYLRVFKEYEIRLKKLNVLDFDDLLLFTGKILSSFPDVRNYWQERFPYILIDEYQDTNHAQYEIVRSLFSKNLCCVGDIDQSIYGFRGADIRNIRQFKDDFPGCKLRKLEQNYRSTGFILQAANALIDNNQGRPSKVLWTDAGDGVKPVLARLRDEKEEALFVMSTLDGLVHEEGYKFKDFCVLYRTNVQSRAIEDSFIKFGIPYLLVNGVRFYDRREIRDVLAYLRALANPSDTTSLVRALSYPKRGVGSATLKKLKLYADSDHLYLWDVLATVLNYKVPEKAQLSILSFMDQMVSLRGMRSRVDDLIRQLLFQTGYLDSLKKDFPGDFEDRLDNILELIGVASAYMEDEPSGDLSGFLDHISLMTDLDKYDRNADAVTLMTVHGAKGLEFPVVFMVGMEEGLFPHDRSLNDDLMNGSTDALEEERRLCYVAITRAERHLYLSCVRNRLVYGTRKDMEPSRFLSEIPSDFILEK